MAIKHCYLLVTSVTFLITFNYQFNTLYINLIKHNLLLSKHGPIVMFNTFHTAQITFVLSKSADSDLYKANAVQNERINI